MIFNPILKEARLVRRYKRFLADVETAEGRLTLHCANTGSMLNCMQEGGRIWFEPSQNPDRKTAGNWILAETPQGRLACVHTHLANRLVEEALHCGVITPLNGFTRLRREVPYGAERSRIDFCLDYAQTPTAYVEVKNVTLGFEQNTIAAFPDAVTERGTKHFRELAALARQGIPTYLIYCISLTDITAVRIAREIDLQYALAAETAREAGVTILAYGTTITPAEIKLTHPVVVH